jgi:hypothetical protein
LLQVIASSTEEAAAAEVRRHWAHAGRIERVEVNRSPLLAYSIETVPHTMVNPVLHVLWLNGLPSTSVAQCPGLGDEQGQ